MVESAADGARTLVVGLDAACPPVLRRLADAGTVPTLAGLLDRGAVGPMESQLPPWTPSAWPSLYTGVNPGKHGVYGFLAFDGYDWDVVDRTRVREHALWELADRHGLTSVVVNVPVTHPPRPVDGAVLPGYVAPEDPTCHPEGLLESVRRAVGDYRVYPRGTAAGTARSDRVTEFRDLARMRGAAFRHLVERFDPEFGFLQFQVTDTVFHEFPGDWDAIRSVYRAVDDQVGEAVDALDPEAVFVVSDHGIGRYDGYEFRVNDHLREHGFVRATAAGTGMPSWDSIARNRLGAGGTRAAGDPVAGLARVGRAALSGGMRAAALAGVTSQRVGAALDRLGVADAVADRVPADVVRAGTERVEFAGSTAYVRDRIELGVRLNVHGREPAGLVPPEEYDWVRDELASLLAAARTPDGDPVFDAVRPREEVFSGPHVEDAPDLVTVPAGFDHLLSASLRGEAFAGMDGRWNHKLAGLFAAAGPAVDADADPAGAHLLDVAPTVLAALGVPASDRMDGSVVPVVDPAGTAEYPPFVASEAAAGPAADGAVTDRLAELGYLE